MTIIELSFKTSKDPTGGAPKRKHKQREGNSRKTNPLSIFVLPLPVEQDTTCQLNPDWQPAQAPNRE